MFVVAEEPGGAETVEVAGCSKHTPHVSAQSNWTGGPRSKSSQRCAKIAHSAGSSACSGVHVAFCANEDSRVEEDVELDVDEVDVEAEVVDVAVDVDVDVKLEVELEVDDDVDVFGVHEPHFMGQSFWSSSMVTVFVQYSSAKFVHCAGSLAPLHRVEVVVDVDVEVDVDVVNVVAHNPHVIGQSA